MAHGQTNTTYNWMTYASALSSADHYAEAVCNTTGAAVICGAFNRHDNSATRTQYSALTGGNSTTGRFLYKWIAGTGTQLDFSAGTAYGQTVRINAVGSSIEAIYSASGDLAATDSAISSGSYCGVTTYNYSSGDGTFDDFVASDGIEAPAAASSPAALLGLIL